MADYKITKIFNDEEEEIIETPINTFKVGNVIKLKDDVKDIYNKDFSKSMFDQRRPSSSPWRKPVKISTRNRFSKGAPLMISMKYIHPSYLRF